MDAGTGAKGVASHYRIVERDRDADRIGDGTAILGELREIGVMGAQELEVHDQQIHLGVADPLPHPERGGMDAVDPGFDR